MPKAAESGVVYEIEAGAVPIKSLPKSLRPREEMDRAGVENVSDATLLAVLIGSGTRGINVMELAARLVRKYESLSALAGASIEELVNDRTIKGLGPARARSLRAALEIGRRLSREEMPAQVFIRAPGDVAAVLRDEVRVLEKERFWVLHLDTKNKLKRRPEPVSEGLVDASLVHPREVFRQAIRSSTSAVVLAHNHPSGDPTPSAEDVRLTRQLIEAGGIVDIRVLDHVILGRVKTDGGREFVSLRESGVVDFGR